MCMIGEYESKITGLFFKGQNRLIINPIHPISAVAHLPTVFPAAKLAA